MPAPVSFDLVVTVAARVWAGVGVEARSGVDAAGAVYDAWQGQGSSLAWHSPARDLRSSPAGPWILRRPGAPARERSGRTERAGGLRPARQGRLDPLEIYSGNTL